MYQLHPDNAMDQSLSINESAAEIRFLVYGTFTAVGIRKSKISHVRSFELSAFLTFGLFRTSMTGVGTNWQLKTPASVSLNGTR